MILSAAMMLDWLADKHDHAPAAAAARSASRRRSIGRSPSGIKPREFGGRDGTPAVAKVVLGRALARRRLMGIAHL